MRLYIDIFFLGIFSVISSMSFAQQRVQGQILVQLKNDANPDDLLKHFYPKPETRLLSKSWNVWLLQFPFGNEEELLSSVKKISDVQTAQFNRYAAPRAVIPNDPDFIDQWNLENTGQALGTAGADIKAPQAWEISTAGVTATGDSIVIAVVDEGFDLQHEDLRFWKNRNEIPNNGIDDDNNGYIDDYHGWDASTHSGTLQAGHHGTQVAGVAAAAGDNGKGITGVAWNALVMPVGVYSYLESEIVEAYSYVFDMRKLYNFSNGAEGAFVVATNSSFGIDLAKPEDYPLWSAIYDSLGSVGILNAVSTTNTPIDVDTAGDVPSTCTSEFLIVVTNTNRYDQKSTGAGFGKISVDLGAPGTAIRTTNSNNSYITTNGTSQASPHVAGAVALMYAAACDSFYQTFTADPAALALKLKSYILRGTDILSTLQHTTVTGGRLNLFNSMNMLVNDFCVMCITSEADVNFPTCYGSLDGSITLNITSGVSPFSYVWSTGDSATATVSGLFGGKYFVKINDATGCEKYNYFDLQSPKPLMVNIVRDSFSNDLRAIVSGGIRPYQFYWPSLPSLTDSVVFPNFPGNHVVQITDANGCVAFDTIFVQDHTSTAGAGAEYLFEIFPNPASAQLFLKFSSSASPRTITVSDLAGKIILEKFFPAKTSEAVLDISVFQKGFYILSLTPLTPSPKERGRSLKVLIQKN